ncbi:DUF1643 domain-containing protein [Bacillus sp. REN3]|uniref:DUF1643 domain-containing protein n=1 Tax=Bacillus sp. REN3 TaxID=2802440 RepID=UPI001AEE19A7|nr:DUF1643 domain-containing protein [Bacillus sp. REN3]
MQKEAVINGHYRYSLKRVWDTANPKKAVFIMLNPSTADCTSDDRTTNRCISFAKNWECGSLEIVNIFALQSTDYKKLKEKTKEEAIGPENRQYIKRALADAAVTVAAWGENVKIHFKKSAAEELKELFSGHELMCLGITKDGFPRHPLFVESHKELEPYSFEKASKRRLNEKGLPYLDGKLLNLIFDLVYEQSDLKGARNLPKDEKLIYFLKALKNLQEYNYRCRFEQTSELFPLFEETIGPFEMNSEGTTLWLALGLALKELYGFRNHTLRSLLKQVNIRK